MNLSEIVADADTRYSQTCVHSTLRSPAVTKFAAVQRVHVLMKLENGIFSVGRIMRCDKCVYYADESNKNVTCSFVCYVFDFAGLPPGRRSMAEIDCRRPVLRTNKFIHSANNDKC